MLLDAPVADRGRIIGEHHRLAAAGAPRCCSGRVVVGELVHKDAAQPARALGIGLLSGGYGEDELARAGAYRVFVDPAGMLHHLDELGVR